VPVYIFAGRNDVNAMSSLVEEYFNVLEAPHKELIWLAGGHGLDGPVCGCDGKQGVGTDSTCTLITVCSFCFLHWL
jgi:hypothetical protein